MNFGPQLMSDPLAAVKGTHTYVLLSSVTNYNISPETYRVLRPSGVAGFTCWTKPGYLASVLHVFPDFKLPPMLTNSWIDPQFIRTTFTEIGFSNIKVETVVFKTRPGGGFGGAEGGMGTYLTLIKVLLPVLREEENAKKYEEYITKEFETKGEAMEMTWEAMVITASK